MKIGVVGTGYWGSNHARVASELADEGVVDDAVACDVDVERVSAVAEEHDLPFVTDHRHLVDVGVDCAVVATPAETHEPVATDLLEMGCHVLVEKPLASTPAAARRIVDAASENDRRLGVGHIFRHHPALLELKDRLDAGDLGDVSQLYTVRHACQPPRDVGALYSLGIHDVDVYRFLLDRNPDTVYCRLDSVVADGTDDAATVVLSFGDVTGVISESWQLPVRGKRRDLVVVGSDGVAYVDYLADTEIELYDVAPSDGTNRGHIPESETPTETVSTAPGEPLKREVREFVTAVREGRAPKTTGEDGVWAVDVLDAAVTAAERNEVVSIAQGVGGRSTLEAASSTTRETR